MINIDLRISRRVLALMSMACIGLLAFGLYLQHFEGLEPCPMCIVQRYCLIGVAVFCGLASMCYKRAWRVSWSLSALAFSGMGLFTAGRQSWLQKFPPEALSCGRDFYGMIENYSISRALPMIFRGSGDCTAADWTLLNLSIANWSVVCFAVLATLLLALLFCEIPSSIFGFALKNPNGSSRRM